MATIGQEKILLDALKIAEECNAEYPRYVALIMALNTILGWADGNQVTVWIIQNKSKWVSLSYEGPLKDMDYQQPFRDENLCLLLSDTEKMTIEVKHQGCLFQASVACPPTNPIIRKNKLPDGEIDSSSVTIAYHIGSDNRTLGKEKVKVISNYFSDRVPGSIFCIIL